MKPEAFKSTLSPVLADRIASDLGLYPGHSEVKDRSFSLYKDNVVNFQNKNGAELLVSYKKPGYGDAYIKLTPISLNCSNWYSLDIPVPLSKVKNAAAHAILLDVASTRSTSVTSVLRLGLPGGRHTDSGSCEKDIKKTRQLHVLTIENGFSQPELQSAISAKIILFFNSRDVSLDLFGFSVDSALNWANVGTKKVGRRMRAKNRVDPTHSVRLNLAKTNPATIQWNTKIYDEELYFDVDSSDGQCAYLTSYGKRATLDLSRARTSEWRTIEGRFKQIKDTGSLGLLLRLAIKAPNLASINPIDFRFRIYDAAFTSWKDTKTILRVTDDAKGELREYFLDVSASIDHIEPENNIGLIGFLPNSINQIDFFEFEAEIVDVRS